MTNESRCIAAIGRRAFAFLFIGDHDALSVEDAPIRNGLLDGVALAGRLRAMRPDIIVIEKPQPGHRIAVPQSRRHLDTVFAHRVSFGIAQGVAAGLGVPSNEISSTRWRRHFGVSKNIQAVHLKALHTWPSRVDLFGKEKHVVRAEAALLALYAARCLSREESR
ncbi:hypothetical protein M2322_003201 [Rhodoblastus acidophilus]|uniref:hypothetical protein n=1 Tax=Rhodoblastus acidophilus TaxID=1074 RepID=UPI00222437F4|nr:hypothetical protein [Rhodoblastus acidophilus]MCW2317637.1 hypothetical protein [Rhodoblastus acidophilus]